MNNPRRSIIKILGLNGLLALVPMSLISFFSFGGRKKSAETTYVNHVFVHFPEGKTITDANRDLYAWTKCDEYTAVLEKFKSHGTLIDFKIARNSEPFVVELHLSSLETRENIIQALAAAQVFNEAKRQDLGYRMTEVLYTVRNKSTIADKQTIRVRA